MKEILTEASTKGLEISKATRNYKFNMINKHFHDSYEIYYLLEGERFYFIDKEIYHVRAGSLVLINREQIHKTSAVEEGWHERILLQINRDIFAPFLIGLGLPNPEDLFANYYGVIELDHGDRKVVAGIFEQLLTEMQLKQEHYELQVKLKLAELMIIINRYCKNQLTTVDTFKPHLGKHVKVNQVATYIWEHSDTNESLEVIADKFYISKSYLSRIFKEVTGFTINEYMNLARIKKAKNLLAHSEYTVTEISERMGYDSITYFERVFKKFTGLSPKQYRKLEHKQTK